MTDHNVRGPNSTVELETTEWNVVVTVHEHGYSRARWLLRDFGEVFRTDFLSVLVVKVNDIQRFLDLLSTRIKDDPSLSKTIAHVIPVRRGFTFQTPEQFEERAKAAASEFISQLAGKSFHVRMHRRGFKGRLSSQIEEQFLDKFLLESINTTGQHSRITFDDPDAILTIETVGQRAGLSVWTREELKRYPFLKSS